MADWDLNEFALEFTGDKKTQEKKEKPVILTQKKDTKKAIEDIQKVEAAARKTKEDTRKAELHKWALDEIQSEKFYSTLRDYYSYREEDDSFKKMSHGDLLDFFYNDRTWGNFNTASLAVDAHAINKEVDKKRLDEFAYINNVYQSLPYFWNDPNRTFGAWLKDMGGALLLDPVNLIGMGVGSAAAKVAYRKALQASLKGKVASYVNGQTIKLGGHRAVKDAGWQAVRKGALVEGAINTPIAGYHDYLLQDIAVETGVQDTFSLKRSLTMAGVGGAIGTAFGGAFSGAGYLLTGSKLQKQYAANLVDLHNYGVSSDHLVGGIRGKRLFEAVANKKTVRTDWFKNLKGKNRAQYLELAEREAHLDVDEQLTSIIDKLNISKKGAKKGEQRLVHKKQAEKELDKIDPKLTRQLNDFLKKSKETLSVKNLTPEEIVLLAIAREAGVLPKDVLTITKKAVIDAPELQKVVQSGKRKIGRAEVRHLADIALDDPENLKKLIKQTLTNDGEGKAAARQLAILLNATDRADSMGKLIEKLNYENITSRQEARVLDGLDALSAETSGLLRVYDGIGRIHAHALEARKIEPEASKRELARLMVDPTDPKMKRLKEGTADERRRFWKKVGELDTPVEIIKALKDVKDINRWDLAAEYINNNLLSSPDTHILNILSSLLQTQWKPLEMLFRSLHMYRADRIRAAEIAREALDTYTYQFVYVAEGLRKAFKSLKAGHPILDSLHNKMDTNIRQGMLGKFLDAMGETFISPIPVVGKLGHKTITPLVKGVVTLPLRVLASGDEFLKTIMFRARAAAQINSIIIRKNPKLIPSAPLSGLPTRTAKLLSNEFIDKPTTQYQRRVRSLFKNYMDRKGATAISAEDIDPNISEITDADRLLINDPIHYAREGTYTNPAFTRDPVEGQSQLWFSPLKGRKYKGKLEGKITGKILGITNKQKWTRVMGLHFINTPSNLIRWNLQRFPILGRAQFQMRQMLATDAKGNYLNNELAAEAKARLMGAWLIWSSAWIAAYSGKVTSGGHRDWKVNREREKATGWQPYAVKTEDGYTSINRLDPFMTPFALMADLKEAIEQWHEYTDEDVPAELSDQWTGLVAAALTGTFRNFSSKFYTKNIIETAEMLIGDGYLHTRDVGRFYAAPLARGLFKITPLSGGLRYASRVNDEWEREVWNMSDKLQTLNPFKGREHISPQRDMFGVKVERKRGWFFGVDLFSSPFATTKWKNPETSKFFARLDREFAYKPPSYTDKHTKINLKQLQNSNKKSKRYGQTAYDRWLEIKSEIKHHMPHLPHAMTLQEAIEHLINTKKGSYGHLPIKTVKGYKDWRQAEILKIIRVFEKEAYWRMYKEYPELDKTRKDRNKTMFQQIRGADYKERVQDKEEQDDWVSGATPFQR